MWPRHRNPENRAEGVQRKRVVLHNLVEASTGPPRGPILGRKISASASFLQIQREFSFSGHAPPSESVARVPPRSWSAPSRARSSRGRWTASERAAPWARAAAAALTTTTTAAAPAGVWTTSGAAPRAPRRSFALGRRHSKQGLWRLLRNSGLPWSRSDYGLVSAEHMSTGAMKLVPVGFDSLQTAAALHRWLRKSEAM